MPYLVLDPGRQRAWKDIYRAGALAAGFDQPQDPYLAVGVVEIAAAIAAGQRRPDPRHLIFGSHHAGGFEIEGQRPALEVDIGIDVMGDGAGIMADADATVHCRRAQPHRAFLLSLVEHLPEAYVVAAVGAGTDRLLEGKVFAPVEIIEIAHRRVVVGTAEQHAADDLDG